MIPDSPRFNRAVGGWIRSESLGFLRCSESGAAPPDISLRHFTVCMGILTLHFMDSWIRLDSLGFAGMSDSVGFRRIPRPWNRYPAAGRMSGSGAAP